MQVIVIEVPVLYPSPPGADESLEIVTGFMALKELISPRFITRVSPCGFGASEPGTTIEGVQVYMSNEPKPVMVGLSYNEFKKRLAAAHNLEMDE